MNFLKPILTFLFLVFTYVMYAQTYTQLSSDTITPGKPYYMLPKGCFVIEIPVVTTILKKGSNFIKYDISNLEFIEKKIGLDPEKYKKFIDSEKSQFETHILSDDSIKISMKAVPDNSKIFYLSSKAKWNKNQSITFNYVEGGILTEGEVSREDKTFDIIVKSVSAVTNIAGNLLTFLPKADMKDTIKKLNDPHQREADSLLIEKMATILVKIQSQGCCENHEVFKEIKAQYEKEFNKLFAQHFYSEKKITKIHRFIYIPSGATSLKDPFPFFSFDSAHGKIYFSTDVENLIWGKIIETNGFDIKKSYKLRFKASDDQLADKFSGNPPKKIGVAYNVPKKVEFHLINPSSIIFFNEIFKVPQFGKIGYVHSIKNGKITQTMDPTTGELLKLSISSSSINGEQIDAVTSASKDIINTVKGDDAATKLEKEVKLLELEKKKQDLLKSLNQK